MILSHALTINSGGTFNQNALSLAAVDAVLSLFGVQRNAANIIRMLTGFDQLNALLRALIYLSGLWKR